jgi:hypothetical protein
MQNLEIDARGWCEFDPGVVLRANPESSALGKYEDKLECKGSLYSRRERLGLSQITLHNRSCAVLLGDSDEI